MTRSPLQQDIKPESLFDIIADESNSDQLRSTSVSSTPEIVEKAPIRKRRSKRKVITWSVRGEPDTAPTLFDEILAKWLRSESTNREEEVFRSAARPEAPESFVREWEYLQERILGEEFEFGKVSETEELFETLIAQYPLEVRAALNRFYIRNFQNPRVLAQILHLISRIDSPELLDLFEVIAVASFVQGNDEVKELGVRCFEAWATPESIKTLETVRTDTIWLKRYINAVIRDLRISYGISR